MTATEYLRYLAEHLRSRPLAQAAIRRVLRFAAWVALTALAAGGLAFSVPMFSGNSEPSDDPVSGFTRSEHVDGRIYGR